LRTHMTHFPNTSRHDFPAEINSKYLSCSLASMRRPLPEGVPAR
jgi:hypothetical protein